MLETGLRPSYPPGAYCLYCQERRSAVRDQLKTTNYRRIHQAIRREWNKCNQAPYQAKAQRLYREYKALEKEWIDIRFQEQAEEA